MPKRGVLGPETPPCFSEFSLRRSPRFRSKDTVGSEKTRVGTNQVHSAPKPAYEKFSPRSEGNVQGFERGVSPSEHETRRRSLRLLNCTKKLDRVNGSRKPNEPTGAAESFLVLRRSSRLSNMTGADKRMNEEKMADTEGGARIEKSKFDGSVTKCRSLALIGNKGKKISTKSIIDSEKEQSIRNDELEKPNRATHMKGNELMGSSYKHICLETKRNWSSRKVEEECSKDDECDKYREKQGENQFQQSNISEKQVSLKMTYKRRSQRDGKKLCGSPDPQEEKKKRKIPGDLCRTAMSCGSCGNLQRDTAHQEWTDNQELALRRAYFTQKPTPNFWKKVSRQVPGKSAQDCFNRIFSELPTPQQHHPRSKAGGTDLSPSSDFSLSTSKLLEPMKLNMKSRSLKDKTAAQKTARHLLKRQHLADQNQEADLFSVLEGDTSSPDLIFSSIKMLDTPDSVQRSNKFLPECHANSNERDLISPPVLKRVKNMALHEKYIDRLHCRDAKRKRMAKFQSRSLLCPQEEGANENKMPKPDIKAAKNALLSDVTNFIKVFGQKQEVSAWEDADVESDEGECEDEF